MRRVARRELCYVPQGETRMGSGRVALATLRNILMYKHFEETRERT